MMTIIDCTTQPEHRVIYGICTTPIPDGWAVIPEGMTLPGVLAYADITTEERDGLPTVTAITPRPDLVAQAEAAAAAAQEEAKKQAEQMAQLPTTEERIAALEAAMLDLLAGEEGGYMVKFYVTQIRLHQFDGAFTIEDVPAKWRARVQAALDKEADGNG